MPPGQHVIVIGTESDALQARIRGLQLRDTLLILLPGPKTAFAFLFRQPLEGTVAENVLRYGVGGLNIDGCRVQSGAKQASAGATTSQNCYGDWQGEYEKGMGRTYTSEGRWPSNLLLVHGPGCVNVGTKRVAAHAAFGSPGDSKGGILNKTGAPRKNPHPGFADEDGTETVTNWICQPDCPVRLLDGQSGRLKSGDVAEHHMRQCSKQEGEGGFCGKFGDIPLTGYGDVGGASRFFPQFADLAEALGWLAKLVTPC